MKIDFVKLARDEDFPIHVPQGVFLEMHNDLTCIINYPRITKEELFAFKKGFKRYSYFESNTEIPIALFLFEYRDPVGIIDCSFNARVVDKSLIDNYLTYENNNIKNALDLFLLDERKIKIIRRSGLDPRGIDLFHATIRKQLTIDYTMQEYEKYLNALYSYQPHELFSMGKIFKHKGK